MKQYGVALKMDEFRRCGAVLVKAESEEMDVAEQGVRDLPLKLRTSLY